MEINKALNINSSNKLVYTNEILKKNDYPQKKGVYNLDNLANGDTDYTEFSIDYSNDEVCNILHNIESSFDFVNNSNDNRTIADCAGEYGKILKYINSNSKIDDKTKEHITKILGNSFDNFAIKRTKYISDKFSDFFNSSYIIQEYTAKNNSLNLGITGDKLIDKDITENNIHNIFVAAKVFYKNNLDATNDKLDKYLQEKFNKTESIDNLSYHDFKCLENSGILSLDFAASGSVKEKATQMNAALNDLKRSGASKVVIDVFTKAFYQNNDKNKRFHAFQEIRFGYEKRLDILGKFINSYSEKLKQLTEKQKELIEEHNKQIEKFKKDMMKLAMWKSNSQNKILEELEKIHSKQLENIDKQKTEIETQKNQLLVEFKKIDDDFKNFLKNPADEISGYLNNPKNNLGWVE